MQTTRSAAPTVTGIIISTRIDKGYGFIAMDGTKDDVFFRATQLPPSLPFDETLRWRRVRFETEPSARGPRALNIAPAD